MKLILRVLEAIRAGADTSNEISEMIGHPVPNVSATITELLEAGLIRRTGRYKRISGRRKSLCVELRERA